MEKIQFRNYLNTNHVLKFIILDCIGNKINDMNLEEYKETGILDIEFKINGVELPVKDFFDKLEKHITEHENKFQKEKHKFISKNSDNAIKQKIKAKIELIYNELQNIEKQLKQ